jgi:predicted pyridoxine 5'-phosphate oxidase superfamily flavin-nucleotide-binding protein
LVRDAGLLETLAANGKTPALAIAVHVEEAFFHCGKCVIRSHLWQHEHWPSLEGLPTLAQTMKDAASIPAPVEVLEGIIKEDEETRLY